MSEIFIENFQLINKEWKIDLENHHFAPLNETIELKQCQWMALKYLLESFAGNLMIEN